MGVVYSDSSDFNERLKKAVIDFYKEVNTKKVTQTGK